jgi:DNA-binding NtrC family response regulator
LPMLHRNSACRRCRSKPRHSPQCVPMTGNELSEGSNPPTPTLNSARADAERDHIVETLTLHQGRVGRAARSLGISRVTLWAKMKRLKIVPQIVSADKALSSESKMWKSFASEAADSTLSFDRDQ